MAVAPGSGSPPLQGVRVVAVEQAVAVPLCTRHLAELGAEVIKIERPGRGDFARHYDTAVGGQSTHFVWLNHGKRSLAVDLRSTEGREVLLALLDRADVFVSNLAPGSIERIIDPETLERRNPRLIHCLIDGYGTEGPYRHRKAYDLLVQGEAGATASTGTAEQPAKPGISLADLGAGTYALAAINAALVARATSGRGQRIHVALFDVVAEWIMPLLLAERYGGGAPPPAGTHHASIVPYGAFQTADGGLINVAVQNEDQWADLCRKVLDAPELLKDQRFASNEERLSNRDACLREVGARLEQLHEPKLIEALDGAGIPWGRLNDLDAVVDHPQLASRDRWVPVDLPEGAHAETLASPITGFPTTGLHRTVPPLGRDTAEILAEIGYDDEAIEDLAVRAVVDIGSGVNAT